MATRRHLRRQQHLGVLERSPARLRGLLAFIRSNNADIIVSTETARLNRRLWNSIGLFRMAESTDLKRIAITDGSGFDLSTPEGIHNAINAAIEAKKEALRTSRRQKRKKRVQANLDISRDLLRSALTEFG